MHMLQALTFYNKSTIHVQPPGLLAIARQVKPRQVKPRQVESSQVESSQAKPSQAKPSRVKASQGTKSTGWAPEGGVQGTGYRVHGWATEGGEDGQRSERVGGLATGQASKLDVGLATVQASKRVGEWGLATVQALLDDAIHSGGWHALHDPHDPLEPPHGQQNHQWGMHEHGPHGQQSHQWQWLSTATGGDGRKHQWVEPYIHACMRAYVHTPTCTFICTH